jgi:hypothetical protein
MPPAKPPACRLCSTSEPIFPRARFAPTTAIERGSKKTFIEALAACWDRSAARATYSGVGSSDSTT